MLPRWSIPLLLVMLAGCSSATRAVRLDTGWGKPIIFTPRSGAAEPVELDEDDFKEAVTKLGRDVPQSAQPRSDARRLFWSLRMMRTLAYEDTSASCPLAQGRIRTATTSHR